MNKILFSLILTACFTTLFGQKTITIKETLNWRQNPVIHQIPGEETLNIWAFEGADYDTKHPTLPICHNRFPVDRNGKLKVEIVNQVYEAFDKELSIDDQFLSSILKFETSISQNRNNYFGRVVFIPIRKNGNSYERLLSFELKVTYTAGVIDYQKDGEVDNSALRNGNIYKFSIAESGIHKLDFNFLKDELGIDIENVDPRNIQILGNGGGMLPERNDALRLYDVVENHIYVSGENDGQFNGDDFILFYGHGPHTWAYDEENQKFNHSYNLYDENAYYFIKISSQNGLRITDQSSVSNSTYTSNKFNDFDFYETEIVNLLHDFSSTQGSGKKWYGDSFSAVRERTYSDFNFPNILSSEPAHIKVVFAGRHNSTSNYFVDVAGQSFLKGISSAGSSALSTYAREATIEEEVTISNSNPSVTVRYPSTGNGNNIGWLDYIELNVKRQLKMAGDQMAFRDINTLDHTISTFELSNSNGNMEIWDIATKTAPKKQLFDLNGNTASFGANTNEALKTYVAFNKNGSFPKPTAIGSIANQDIHDIDNIDMLIVYPEEFKSVVEAYKDHRESNSNLTLAMVDINQVFNEFASGAYDPTAIRNYVKFLAEKNERFKYLLLFGDGSFDHKNILGLEEDETDNLIPVYETNQSLEPIDAFPSDDYFALLSEDEGNGNLSGELDIAVGRIPARNVAEAQAMLNKLINYETNVNTLGDWRNNLVFIGDDEDGSGHVKDADEIAGFVKSGYPVFNKDKIYFDAYPQIATPGGERFPDATAAINRAVFKGSLVVNYLGHGGAKGWAQERVLQTSDIGSWENYNKLPLFVTATCSLTGYDDPNFTTAGELTYLNEKGGAIALMTTTRAVYSNSNFALTKAVFDIVFEQENGSNIPIGETFRRAKNNSSASFTNSRKFALIGDPSMTLALPELDVVTTTINGHDVSDGLADTIGALQKVTITGFVADHNGNLQSNFNGKIFPTIFDKRVDYNLLQQDSGSNAYTFSLQKNIIFKGVASVTNGNFEFSFVVPKDINYDFGKGKISYYAHDNEARDANGFYDNIVIGGTSSNAIFDDQGPLVEVYMNTEDFVFGGLTDENPTLLVKLSDDNGINVIGNSIGHDLTGTLDQNTSNIYLLNDFYEAELDDYTKGTVRYPLFDLEEGIHNIKVKAWDIANNSAEGYTEFVVAKSGEVALDHVLNYPNPFTDVTYFQFEHNLHNQEVDILVQVFTVSGRLVKTIEEQVVMEGNRMGRQLEWDGKDDYGDQLAKGVYLYKVKLKSLSFGDSNVKAESDFEKLVILK